LPVRQFSFADDDGYPALADVFYVAMAIIGTRMGNIDIDQYLIAFCTSSFHSNTPDCRRNMRGKLRTPSLRRPDAPVPAMLYMM